MDGDEARRRKRTYRRRPRALEEDEEEEGEEEGDRGGGDAGEKRQRADGASLREALREAKLLQRARGGAKGTSTEELAIPAERQAQLELISAAGAEGRSVGAAGRAAGAIGLMFAENEGGDEADPDEDAHANARHMDAYVEREMERLRKEEEGDGGAAAGGREDPALGVDGAARYEGDDIHQNRERLYETPSELLVKSSAQRKLEAGIANESATGMSAEGLSSIGIVEVDLDISAKIANIEATERARADWLQKHANRRPGAVPAVGAHDSRNRSNDAIMAMRFKRRERERGRR